jgi:hypothetical protein
MHRHNSRRPATWGLAIVMLITSGCSFFPEALQPQNLQKWNRGPGPSSDPFFSVPDDAAELVPADDPFDAEQAAAMQP